MIGGCGLVLVVLLKVVACNDRSFCGVDGDCTKMMRAIGYNTSDGSVFVEATPVPLLKEGEVLIKVAAAGVNRLDLLQVQGRYPPPTGESEILGVEVSGTIERLSLVAEAKSKLKVGDKVMALIGGGGYAEYATAPYQCVMILPDVIDVQQGASIPEVYITAYQALVWNADLQDGHSVLIHAGASGVGVAAIQLAKALRKDVKVIATSRTNEKLPICVANRADLVINSKEKDFSEEVLKFTGGSGVDVILDFVGGSFWDRNLNCIATDGHIILLALLGGAMTEDPANLGLILRKRITIRGSTLRSRSLQYKEKLIQEVSDVVLPLFNTKQCWPLVDSVYTLDNTGKAHQKMRQNLNKGKILISL